MSTIDEKALVKKIDRHILPLMFGAYMLQFLDKTSLGYTAIFGLREDLKLVGNQYSWASSAFYFGYLAASYPVAICLVKLPLSRFLGVTFLVWAVVLSCHAAAQNFTGLMILRTLLGVLEAGITPGLSMMTAIWYKRSEHGSRHGVWFAGNSTAAIFGGLLGFGIGHIENSVASWRWIFIIFGILTFAYGILFLMLLPDSPRTARFLNEDEREPAYQRPQQETRSTIDHKWFTSEFIEALIDLKTWLIFIATVASCIPNGGLTSFGSIIVASFGFSVFNTLLLQIPASVFALFYIASSSIFVSRVRYSRCLTGAAMYLVSLAGSLMMSQISPENKVARLAGLWLFGAFSAAHPITLSIVASNVGGYTKKATVSAILFIGYCTGNIIGPFLFFSHEAPSYESAWVGIMISLGIAVCAMIALRQLCAFLNQQRDRQQEVHIDPEVKDRASQTRHVVVETRNETDWKNARFRYYL
ncbi:major facilitator superfamily domain-containing protein [Aspergillus granulosus]|uniref:Major facilitator superfamily domain-containing protein n=1 Tax=Aspergillus granulosus TaxID=176169 RepID=A0ABR4GSN5_9EURO